MGSKLNPSSSLVFLGKLATKSRKLCPKVIAFSAASFGENIQARQLKSELYTVKFRALRDCKLGIARYPDFEYNAEGGNGIGSASKVTESESNDEVFVSFDINTLYIPPLTSSTTKFLGLPLPPFLKIRIDPEIFSGNINKNSGKVELEFKAKFWFSIGSIYKAPPLVVATVLTSEESAGKIRSGRGDRLDKDGNCRMVGVAIIDPIDDFLLNSFLRLPTECIADLNAVISFSSST